MIDAFAAQLVVLRAADPTPLPPLRLPKHVRYRCATPRRGFVLTNRMKSVSTTFVTRPNFQQLTARF